MIPKRRRLTRLRMQVGFRTDPHRDATIPALSMNHSSKRDEPSDISG